MKPTRIIIFAKTPIAGVAKTRLIPALGREKSGFLAQLLLQHCVSEALKTQAIVELCVAPSADDQIWKKILPELHKLTITEQGTGDLGARLIRASQRAITNDEQVILIGTDCPALGCSVLQQAITDLNHYDSIIIPAYDGGYTLLGFKQFDRTLFTDIRWSTSEVCDVTIRKIQQLKWTLKKAEALPDIDEEQDLVYLPSQIKQSINYNI